MREMSFEEFGSALWEQERERDAFVLRILEYYHSKDSDKAFFVADDSLGSDPLFDGVYHALIGLNVLEPYIDKQGCECARFTPFGREVYRRLKA